jgi:O-antigen/teichoic acid export membrane protein
VSEGGRIRGRFTLKGVDETELYEDGDSVLDALEPARPRRGGLLRSGAIAGAAVLGSNLINVGFQLSTARLLPPAEYSLLVTLFSVLLISNVPVLSLQARVARDVAHAKEAGDLDTAGALLVDSLRPLARWGAIVVICLALASIPVALTVNVDRELPFLALIVAVLATLPLPISWGGLQGLERFPTLAGVQLLYAVLKLAVGVGLAAAGFGAAAIVFGIAIATLLSFAVSLLPLRSLLASGARHARGAMKLLDAYTVRAALILAAIAALTNLDLIASRVFLTEHEAGLYAAAGVATRSLLLLPTVATTVLFPRVATLRERSAERDHLLGGLVAVALLGLVPVVLFLVIPEPLLKIGFGDDYADAASFMGSLGVAMMIYALVEVYAFHFLALGRLSYAWVLGVGLALLVVLFGFLHDSPEQLITAQIITATALLVMSEAFDRAHRRARRAGTDTRPAVGAGAGAESS